MTCADNKILSINYIFSVTNLFWNFIRSVTWNTLDREYVYILYDAERYSRGVPG